MNWWVVAYIVIGLIWMTIVRVKMGPMPLITYLSTSIFWPIAAVIGLGLLLNIEV